LSVINQAYNISGLQFAVCSFYLNLQIHLIIVKIQLNSTNKLILLHNGSVIHHHLNELIVLLLLLTLYHRTVRGQSSAVRVGAKTSHRTGGSRGGGMLLGTPPLPD
jgi:hypothetical protein